MKRRKVHNEEPKLTRRKLDGEKPQQKTEEGRHAAPPRKVDNEKMPHRKKKARR